MSALEALRREVEQLSRELLEAQEEIAARRPRPKSDVATQTDEAVELEEIEVTQVSPDRSSAASAEREDAWDLIVQGAEEDGRKGVDWFPSKPVAAARLQALGVRVQSERGSGPINGDDFVIARKASGASLFAVFSGRGPDGCQCSAFARATLPERLFAHPSRHTDVREAVVTAFRETHSLLRREDYASPNVEVALVLVQSMWSAEGSAKWLFCAHAGSCRVVLASRKSDGRAFGVAALTPDDPQALGGPEALCEPAFSAHKLGEGDALLLLGSKGLFAAGNKEVMRPLLKQGVDAIGLVCSAARREEPTADITAMAVELAHI